MCFKLFALLISAITFSADDYDKAVSTFRCFIARAYVCRDDESYHLLIITKDDMSAENMKSFFNAKRAEEVAIGTLDDLDELVDAYATEANAEWADELCVRNV